MTGTPTLCRAVKHEADAKNHYCGMLWFRPLKYFRKIEGPGRDSLEGVGTYTVQGILHRDVSDKNPIFPPFVLCFSEIPLERYGDFVLALRRPDALRDRVLSNFPSGTQAEWHRAAYHKRENLDVAPGPTEHWNRKHYAKPARFADEREWRLVVFLPAPFRLLDDTFKPHVGNLQGLLRLMPSG